MDALTSEILETSETSETSETLDSISESKSLIDTHDNDILSPAVNSTNAELMPGTTSPFLFNTHTPRTL